MLSSTEYAGLGAGRGGRSSAVLMGRTRSGSAPASASTARTKPHHVVAPPFVTWKMPGLRSSPRVTIAGARSAVKVGEPCWSSTKRSSSSSSARRSAVATMLAPWAPHSQLVRTMVDPGRHSRSPASFDAPYTEDGCGTSHSR